MSRSSIAILSMLALLAGCAIRLGGPKPREYRTLALEVTDGSSADDVARVVRDAGADIVLITGPQDSAWFSQVSAATGLALSGPGLTEPRAKAFLTNLKVLGDTSIVLGVGDGSRMHMHDALYEISEGRHIDLMLVGIPARSDLREAMRSLLGYIATDVGANAAIMLAVDAPSAQAADSIATLLRAAYASAGECIGPNGPRRDGTVRLFYGPSARVQCRGARVLPDDGSPILADLLVRR